MITIKTDNGYYGAPNNLFVRKNINIEPGLTVLIGCNGSGKTTCLKLIKNACKEQNIPCFAYDNLSQGGSNGIENCMRTGNYAAMARNLISSEGEKIIVNLEPAASQIGQFVRKNQNSDKIVITMDAIDSGLDIEGINLIKNCLLRPIIADCRKNNIEAYIIIAANAYETANGEKCLYPRSGNYKTFSDYESYKVFILKSAEAKNNRYKVIKEKANRRRGA